VNPSLVGSTGYYVEGIGYTAGVVIRKTLGGKGLRMITSGRGAGMRIAAYLTSGVALPVSGSALASGGTCRQQERQVPEGKVCDETRIAA